MSDMSTDVRAADAADAATSAQVTHVRRNLWGRLYHGETAIDFYGRRKWGLTISGVLIVITLVSLFSRGLNLGIDFEGGVAWEVPSAQITDDQVRTVLDDTGVESAGAKIQELTSDSGSRWRVQVGDQSPETVQAVQEALASAAKVDVSEVSSTSVSSSWGRSITEKAVRALVTFKEPGVQISGSMTYPDEAQAKSAEGGVREAMNLSRWLALIGVKIQNPTVSVQKTDVQVTLAADDQSLRQLIAAAQQFVPPSGGSAPARPAPSTGPDKK